MKSLNTALIHGCNLATLERKSLAAFPRRVWSLGSAGKRMSSQEQDAWMAFLKGPRIGWYMERMVDLAHTFGEDSAIVLEEVGLTLSDFGPPMGAMRQTEHSTPFVEGEALVDAYHHMHSCTDPQLFILQRHERICTSPFIRVARAPGRSTSSGSIAIYSHGHRTSALWWPAAMDY